ncbi:Aste57867_23707 [Aphanomyces stellatus]|uniref:Aste57867_23707 protein n=1 Tax=Aphanomyces stellatus TaxID=120398 RepID=A0A485LNI0_9STRA|nr:hypothetical protein As57867_023635 [Aphanomyces stellatus]VFU00352.1 Aste57867_23707 [Aphanomyces stellatus]
MPSRECHHYQFNFCLHQHDTWGHEDNFSSYKADPFVDFASNTEQNDGKVNDRVLAVDREVEETAKQYIAVALKHLTNHAVCRVAEIAGTLKDRADIVNRVEDQGGRKKKKKRSVFVLRSTNVEHLMMLFTSGVMHLTCSQYECAIADFNAVIASTSPNFGWEVHFARANALAKMSKYELALEDLNLVLNDEDVVGCFDPLTFRAKVYMFLAIADESLTTTLSIFSRSATLLDTNLDGPFQIKASIAYAQSELNDFCSVTHVCHVWD